MKHLKNGYHFRPATKDDLATTVDMFNRWSNKKLGIKKFTLAQSDREWNTPSFNLETDTHLAFTRGGELAGYYEVWDLYQPHVRMHCWGCIHPSHAGNGLATQLLAWAEQRARLSIQKAPEDARVVLVGHTLSGDEDAVQRYLENGFNLIRHFLRMVIDLNGNPVEPSWPEGIELHTMETGQDVGEVVRAIRDAFKDHWGHVEAPYEEELARWQHIVDTDPDYDPSLWFLAKDGPEIAGFSLCYPRVDEDPEMGWIGSLGVRRPWRRRGLALALLHHSFQVLARRDLRRAGLGVDAQSLTGATRLYEKAGMHSDPRWQFSQFEKELRPGEDLSTQVIDP